MHATFAVLLAAAIAAPATAFAEPAAGTAKAAAAAAKAEQAVERVVYHINDASLARVAMRNIENHLDATPDAKIVVVTHGKGIDFMLNDARDDKGPYQGQVAGLRSQGVEFRVCRNTLKGRNLTDDAVILEGTVVPSGVAEIGRLQAREGYVYLKP